MAACGDILEDLEGRYLQALWAERAHAQTAITRSALSHIVGNIVDLSMNLSEGMMEIHSVHTEDNSMPIVISNDEEDTPGNIT